MYKLKKKSVKESVTHAFEFDASPLHFYACSKEQMYD